MEPRREVENSEFGRLGMLVLMTDCGGGGIWKCRRGFCGGCSFDDLDVILFITFVLSLCTRTATASNVPSEPSAPFLFTQPLSLQDPPLTSPLTPAPHLHTTPVSATALHCIIPTAHIQSSSPYTNSLFHLPSSPFAFPQSPSFWTATLSLHRPNPPFPPHRHLPA